MTLPVGDFELPRPLSVTVAVSVVLPVASMLGALELTTVEVA
jgi:hypothetical protein